MNPIDHSLFNPNFSFGSSGTEDVHAPAQAMDATQVLEHSIQQVGGNTGIPAEHLRKLHHIARENDCVIAFRPFDPLNRSLVEQGHPTKSQQIKGKSSDLGPLYGFIPVQQALSKVRGRGPEAIAKADQDIKAVLEKQHARAIALRLPQERLGLLQDEGLIRLHAPLSDGTRKITLPGDSTEFTARLADNGKSFEILHGGEAVQVLAPMRQPDDPLQDKPLTADYDLFVIMPNWGQVGEQTNRRLSQPGLRDPLSGVMPGGPKDGGTDHITALERRIANQINERLRPDIDFDQPGNAAWRLVHHGADQGNPQSDLKDNFPATLILPRQLGEHGPVTILRDPGALNAFIQQHGGQYPMVRNTAWNQLSGHVGRRASDLSTRSNEPSPAPSRKSSLTPQDLQALQAASARRNSRPQLFGERRGSLAPFQEQEPS
ncbi:hypothetical protein AWM79_01265 [Pseudomonas agarici]|uniref:Anthrax toxin edema factor central domain-containing protein n=1 Tax=Pseudomonas agarici TaxID=46677 RepID=A0A0X1SWB3_PSEAA|nr:anthrax toxin-like adenylyl cyclase domain-containing protein [Pseudomonas agarici]AMB84008.1 hypothetical protein AWM79_01265 [Pseudomonas agarici]